MIEAALIIVACLVNDPRDCRSIDTLIRLPMTECAVHGQQAALGYVRRYPFFEDRRLAGWSCETGEPS